jgi:hypothetical protein
MTDLAARLALLAAQGRTITYGALARDLGWRMADLTAALEVLMAEDAARGMPFRASLMEARLTPGQPAPGFFDAAAALGRPIPAEAIAKERMALFAAARRATSAP